MLSVDLPVNFEQLGIPDVKDEKLREVAELLRCLATKLAEMGNTSDSLDACFGVGFSNMLDAFV